MNRRGKGEQMGLRSAEKRRQDRASETELGCEPERKSREPRGSWAVGRDNAMERKEPAPALGQAQGCN